MNADECVTVCHNAELGDAGTLDIFRPELAKPIPFVLAIHGGAWVRREQREQFRSLLWPRIRPLGCALVLASYRLAPAFRFPCAYDDLVSLLAWLKIHAPSYGLDASRCGLLGASAGGHLAMLLATRATMELRPMPKIRGVVNYCGITDLSAQYAYEETHGRSMVKTFLGFTPDANATIFKEASPLCYVHRDVPPVWMAHGTQDQSVPIEQSRALFKKLSDAGHDPVYLEARGLDHTMLERSSDGGAWIEPAAILFEHDMLRFLRRSLA